MVVESVVLIVAIILAVLVFLRFIPLNLWISALASGVHVSIFTLMGMRIRRVPPAKIVGPLIKAEKAGLNMQISKMEAHFLAGGNLDRVITALITARGANIKLDFPEDQSSGACRSHCRPYPGPRRPDPGTAAPSA